MIDLLNCKAYIENHMRVFPVDTKKKKKKRERVCNQAAVHRLFKYTRNLILLKYVNIIFNNL